jgi:aminobenzoyl-glutamate transport protein
MGFDGANLYSHVYVAGILPGTYTGCLQDRDSVSNIISPMMSFFALIIAYIQKYKSRTGIGTIIATMLPYSIAFFFVWTALLIIWIFLGLPLGPGAGLYYTM